MTGFTDAMTDVLAISLTLGTDTYTLGGIALGSILLVAGIGFWKGLKRGR
jgi:hypothetical protein